MCLRWLPCYRQDENGSHNNGDESSEDSEIVMIRRRREAKYEQKMKARTEFLENVLITKTFLVAKNAGTINNDDDIFSVDEDTSLEVCCPICLISYESGNLISFSHNPFCQHHFHRECIVSWLKSHDACPCCRQDYLSFGDENRQVVDPGPNEEDPESSMDRNHEEEVQNSQLNRLYGTGNFTTPTEDSNTPSIHLGNLERDERETWERRLEGTLERLTQQVQAQVQATRHHIQTFRESNRARQNEENVGQDAFEDDGERGRVERSINLLRHQLALVRQAAGREIQNRSNGNVTTESRNTPRRGRNRREEYFEDAIQVVRSRLEDIASSEQAHRVRERSTRTFQKLMKHARSSIR